MKERTKMGKKIHIELTEKAEKELELLKQSLGATSTSEVIRVSLALTQFLQKERIDGKDIIVRDNEEKTDTKIMW